MTTLLLILALFGPIDRERFLVAISEVESGNNPKAIGRSGERTQWQIAPISFRELKRLGKGMGNPAHRLFDVHLARMQRAGVAVSVEKAALVWHHGFEGAKRRKWKPTDYSRRVVSLYTLSLPAANPKPAPLSPHRPVARAVTLSK